MSRNKLDNDRCNLATEAYWGNYHNIAMTLYNVYMDTPQSDYEYLEAWEKCNDKKKWYRVAKVIMQDLIEMHKIVEREHNNRYGRLSRL